MKAPKELDASELLLKNEEVQSKLYQRRRGWRKLEEEFQTMFNDFYNRKREFKRIVDTGLPKDDRYHEFLEITEWGRLGIEDSATLAITRIREPKPLMECYWKLLNYYKRGVLIKWVDFQKTFHIMSQFFPSEPYWETYTAIGDRLQYCKHETKRPYRTNGPYWAKMARVINGIAIKDETASGECSLLYELMQKIDRDGAVPTVIKYLDKNGLKRLLVSLPELLDISTLQKEYSKVLSQIHNEFYGIKFKGRPETKESTRDTIRKIWNEKCKGKKLSNNQQAKIISEELNKIPDASPLEPISIVRHYLPLIKGRKRDKK